MVGRETCGMRRDREKMNYWKGEHVELRGLELEDAPFFNDWNKEVETQKTLDQIWFPSTLILAMQ